MAKARKCDRCGKFYEHYDPDSDEFKFIKECIDYCKEERKNDL